VDNGCHKESVILIWEAQKSSIPIHSWIEVRDLLYKYDPNSAFHKVHDVKRVNISDLHCGRVCFLLPEWDGYEIVEEIFNNV